MKFRVLRSVEPSQVRRVVHHDYLPLLPDELTGAAYTLVLFRENQRVVKSSVARKAVASLGGDEPVLAFGPSFTREAASDLERAGVRIVTRDRTFWTDESHEETVTAIGARVKRPPGP